MALLEAKGLVKFYGRRKVVAGVDFSVDAGEVVGLLGPNGAGKTTSFRMITGQIEPNEGSVTFNGEDVTAMRMYMRARQGMGYLPQEHSIFRRLSVEQNIVAILEALPVCRSLGRKLTRKERWERCDAVLDQFGLQRVRKNNAARLSGGEKRRLEIARCLVCEPLLILLDEPFTGIDPKTIGDIQQIVRDLCHQGIGILLTDHNVREALKITDRSYLIKDGQVRTHGTPNHIINDPTAIAEYLGKTFSDISLPGGPVLMPGVQNFPSLPDFAMPPSAGLTSSPPPAEKAQEVSVHMVLENEKLHRLVERLKTDADGSAAAELVQRGQAAVSGLLEALERRDVELRRQAFAVLQKIVGSAGPFDPYAPEAQRRQQIADLRSRFERKAG
jgi:lipopolysaccharide export system ATP-binding protein